MIGVDFKTVDKIMEDNQEALKLLCENHKLYQQSIVFLVAENEKKLAMKQQEIDQLQANHAAMLCKKSEKIGKLESQIYGLQGQVEELQVNPKTSTLSKVSCAMRVIGIGLLIVSGASSITGIVVAIAPLLLIAAAGFLAIGLLAKAIDHRIKSATVFKDSVKGEEISKGVSND